MAYYINKSTLNTVTVPDTSIQADGFIPFNTNVVLTGKSIEHTAGSTEIDLLYAGIYLVEFGCDCLPGTQVLTTFQLQNNGNNVAGATAAFTGQSSVTNSVSFSTLIKVLPSCCMIDNTARLQVMCDVASTVGNCYFTVVKVA